MEIVDMPIVQVPLDVPDDIYKSVQNGTLELLGMVKDGQHKVRKHIPRAKLPKANEYEVKIAKPEKGTQDSITSLKSYLEIQKEILANAA